MMTRQHHIAIAKAIRDSDTFDSHASRVQFAREMADVIEPLSKRFDRETFMAFATSDTEQ